jgi:hypothetical protein
VQEAGEGGPVEEISDFAAEVLHLLGINIDA